LLADCLIACAIRRRRGRAAAGVRVPMLYEMYQAMHDWAGQMRAASSLAGRWLDTPWLSAAGWPEFATLPWPNDGIETMRRGFAACQLIAQGGVRHTRPDWGIERVRIGERELAVAEEAVASTPFATLRRFVKEGQGAQPRILLVAPMSGHFATLLRATARTLLVDHDVYVTDWHNARDVPLSAGRFDFDDFVEHVMDFLRAMGPGGHVLAVCQPAAPVLAAVALMAADRDRATPRSMTLMAGPIDTRITPTEVDMLATGKPMGWFESNLIGTVPPGFGGSGRRVYPGFVQLMSFMSMNLDRHTRAHMRQWENLAKGDAAAAAAHRAFYDEYFSVMDLPAEFYLQTIERIFQRHELPRGEMMVRGRKVEPRAITRTALLAVEGELDDICGIGQTMAALDLCSGLSPLRKRYHLQTGAGHYGVFSGRRWSGEIYPLVREMIATNSA
jgi:poly(3-hydroxybutyrate) depolymerase